MRNPYIRKVSCSSSAVWSIFNNFCYKNIKICCHHDSIPRPGRVQQKLLRLRCEPSTMEKRSKFICFVLKKLNSIFVWIISNEKTPRILRFRGNRIFRWPPVKICYREKKTLVMVHGLHSSHLSFLICMAPSMMHACNHNHVVNLVFGLVSTTSAWAHCHATPLANTATTASLAPLYHSPILGRTSTSLTMVVVPLPHHKLWLSVHRRYHGTLRW
jgi:hypothetical protein